MWPNAKSDTQNKINSEKKLHHEETNSTMKVQVERFHWNGHSIGFCSRTQKLESPYKTPLFTLVVKRVEPPLDWKILMWTKCYGLQKNRTIMSVQIFLNLHLSFQRLRLIMSFARLNYTSV